MRISHFFIDRPIFAAVVSIVFVILGGACVVGWKLDADRHAGVRAQLDARDAGLEETPVAASFQPSTRPF